MAGLSDSNDILSTNQQLLIINLAVATNNSMTAVQMVKLMIGSSLQFTHWGYLGDWDNYVSGTINA